MPLFFDKWLYFKQQVYLFFCENWSDRHVKRANLLICKHATRAFWHEISRKLPIRQVVHVITEENVYAGSKWKAFANDVQTNMCNSNAHTRTGPRLCFSNRFSNVNYLITFTLNLRTCSQDFLNFTKYRHRRAISQFPFKTTLFHFLSFPFLPLSRFISIEILFAVARCIMPRSGGNSVTHCFNVLITFTF